MTDIVEFLTARLDEREHLARAVEHAVGDQYDALMAGLGDTYQLGIVSLYWRSHDPARVLAEVAAKRAIIAEHKHVPATEPSTHNFGCEICAYDRGDCVQYGWGWCNTVRLLAAPYADHPDYNPAWRVE